MSRPHAIGPLAASLATLGAAPAAAQAVACSFTMVCAPQIGCEPHDGIPFDLVLTAEGAQFDRDGAPLAGTTLPTGPDAPLGLLFEDGAGRLLLTLATDGAAALTEHRHTAAGRIETSTFTGTCEVVQ